jgi:flagellar biosynthetic protein FlhB
VAEENDAQEKTEEPTQRRLEKAREEGQILTSKEVMVFATSTMGLILVVAFGLVLPGQIGVWKGYFALGPAESLDTLVESRLGSAFGFFFIASLLVGLPVLVAVIAAQTAVGGLNFAAGAAGFKGDRIDPLKGLARIFSLKGLVELAKSILKVALLGWVCFVIISAILPDTLRLSSASLAEAGAALFEDFLLLLAASLGVLALMALLDFLWSRHTHLEKLRMSRQDLKEEHKTTEGSPEIKARIRRLQIEASRRAAKAAGALANVGQATAIITNPTHFAVALRYQPGDSGAPMIVAMGKGEMARQIIERGRAAGVNVYRSPLLARALYFTGEIGQEISDKLYGAVAAVLAYLYRIDRGEDPAEPEVDLPEDLRFTEDGKPIAGGRP